MATLIISPATKHVGRMSMKVGFRSISSSSVLMLPHQSRNPKSQGDRNGLSEKQRYKRQKKPSHKGPYADDTFVLTLHTDGAHHERMRSLRKQYFPSGFIKGAPHLTLFYGLPASKMDVIIPAIQDISSRTSAFPIHAASPIKLENGIGVAIATDSGGGEAQRIYEELHEMWQARGVFIGDDHGPGNLRYIIMDKVTKGDAIDRAFQEVQKGFQGDRGTANALSLWRYQNNGWLAFQRRFDFRAGLW